MSSTCCTDYNQRDTKPPTRRPIKMAPAVCLTASLIIVVIASTRLSVAKPVRDEAGAPARQNSNERLLASLNESLVRLSHAESPRLPRANASPSSSNTSSGEQQKHQQQQIVALKKISCDKLSLVIMAQRVLNVSASSGALKRLDECREENLLDLELMEMFERASLSANNALNESDAARLSSLANASPPRDRKSVKPDSPLSAECDRPANQESPACIGPPKLPPEVQRADGLGPAPKEFHLGAQVALALLVAGLLLVGAATVLDCQQTTARSTGGPTQRDDNQELDSERTRKPRRDSSNARFFLDIGPQTPKLRDYRSLSISSNCSSSLFCSTNSVASSSAPILSSGNSNSSSSSGNQPSSNHAPGKQFSAEANRAVCCAEQQVRNNHHQYESNLALHFNPTYSVGQQANLCASDGQKSRPSDRLHLAAQILLAFSLRKTMGQIFQRQTTGQAKSDAHFPPQTQESVDSLHGLRFLSMIWVIVIHSYNFAMRWMLFTNTSTLDGIYKSAASQIIANGSFACDSFFFVGGFLLPYLALQQHGAKRQTATNDELDDDGGDYNLAHASAAKQRHKRQQAPGRDTAYVEAEGEARAATRTNCCRHVSESGRQTRASFGVKQHFGSPIMSNLSAFAETSPPSCCHLDSACVSCSHCHQHRRQPSRPPFIGIQNEGPPSQDGCFACTSEPINNNNNSNRSLEMNTNEMLASGLASCHSHAQHVCVTRQSAILAIKLNHPATEDLTNGSGLRRGEATAKKTATSGGGSRRCEHQFSWQRCAANIVRRYVRMMPLMMAIIGLCTSLLRYLGSGPVWQESTMMYDDWCRRNWWVNAMFLHNFVNRENMCLSHSWYSAVDFQLFLVGQLILFVTHRSRRLGLALLLGLLLASPLITMALTLRHQLPAVPLISGVSEKTMNFYYGEIYIKPYSRAAPYLIGILLAYLMRTTSLASWRLKRWQNLTCWTLAISLVAAIILAMQPAMNGLVPSQLESALYSGWARPLWACAVGWIIFACITKQAGLVGQLLGARCFVPLSRLTYPAFLIHPIIMASFYGTRQASFQFSHYLMLYLILGNIVITYASAFILAVLIELPLLSIERVISGRLFGGGGGGDSSNR